MSNFEVQENDQCGNADQVNYSSESFSTQLLGDLNVMSLTTIEMKI